MINVMQTIPNLDGTEFCAPDSKEPSTLRRMLVDTLVMTHPDEKIDPGEKFMRGKLAERIHTEARVKVDPKEVVILKALVAKTYVNNVLVMRIWEILDAAVDTPVAPVVSISKEKDE